MVIFTSFYYFNVHVIISAVVLKKKKKSQQEGLKFIKLLISVSVMKDERIFYILNLSIMDIIRVHL